MSEDRSPSGQVQLEFEKLFLDVSVRESVGRMKLELVKRTLFHGFDGPCLVSNFCWNNPAKIRCCKYLNNIVEHANRRVKLRLSAMLGFKSFRNAPIVIAGIELIQKLKKRQYGVPFSFGDSSLDIWTSVLAA